MDLKEAQRRVDDWISQFEESYWPPLANLARLVEEVGELAREINHRFGTKPKRPDEPDLDEALERVLEKYRARDGERWKRKKEAPEV
jgi:NTP pyrophosphatase (non-canonical NTP hydrolase)